MVIVFWIQFFLDAAVKMHAGWNEECLDENEAELKERCEGVVSV